MALDTEQAKAFDFAQETTKQLLTLSTAVIALTIAFTKDIVQGGSATSKVVLAVSWGLLLVSAASGIITLMALTGSLGAADGQTPPSIRSPNITRPAMVQALAFLIGLVLTIVAGAAAL
jgi:hypothetical protein